MPRLGFWAAFEHPSGLASGRVARNCRNQLRLRCCRGGCFHPFKGLEARKGLSISPFHSPDQSLELPAFCTHALEGRCSDAYSRLPVCGDRPFADRALDQGVIPSGAHHPGFQSEGRCSVDAYPWLPVRGDRSFADRALDQGVIPL